MRDDSVCSEVWSRGSQKNKRNREDINESLYLAYVFASGIVRNAAKRLYVLQRGDQLYSDFLLATQNYDLKGNDFQFSLGRADARGVYVFPEGARLGREESVIMKVSFNHARERHPLLCSKNLAQYGGAPKSSVPKVNVRKLFVPTPNLCAVFVMEKDLSLGEETEPPDEAEDVEILDSHKKLLSFERARRRAGVLQVKNEISQKTANI